MSKQPFALGETFHKAGRPRILWTVERFNLNTQIAHVVLARRDDPSTKITVAADALSNPWYFRRAAVVPPVAADRR